MKELSLISNLRLPIANKWRRENSHQDWSHHRLGVSPLCLGELPPRDMWVPALSLCCRPFDSPLSSVCLKLGFIGEKREGLGPAQACSSSTCLQYSVSDSSRGQRTFPVLEWEEGCFPKTDLSLGQSSSQKVFTWILGWKLLGIPEADWGEYHLLFVFCPDTFRKEKEAWLVSVICDSEDMLTCVLKTGISP